MEQASRSETSRTRERSVSLAQKSTRTPLDEAKNVDPCFSARPGLVSSRSARPGSSSSALTGVQSLARCGRRVGRSRIEDRGFILLEGVRSGSTRWSGVCANVLSLCMVSRAFAQVKRDFSCRRTRARTNNSARCGAPLRDSSCSDCPHSRDTHYRHSFSQTLLRVHAVEDREPLVLHFTLSEPISLRAYPRTSTDTVTVDSKLARVSIMLPRTPSLAVRIVPQVCFPSSISPLASFRLGSPSVLPATDQHGMCRTGS